MINIQKTFLLTKKTTYIIGLISIFVMLIIFLFYLNTYGNENFLIDKSEKQNEFIENITRLLEVIGVLLSLVFVMTFFNKQNDEYKNFLIVNKYSKFEYFISKTLFLNLFMLITITVYFCVFVLIIRFSSQMNLSAELLFTYISFVITSLTYLNYAILLYSIGKNELFSVLVLVFYWLGFFFKTSSHSFLFSLFFPSITGNLLYFSYLYYCLLVVEIILLGIVVYMIKE